MKELERSGLELRCVCDRPNCSIVVRYDKEWNELEFFARTYNGTLKQRICKAWRMLWADFDEDFVDCVIDGKDAAIKLAEFVKDVTKE